LAWVRLKVSRWPADSGHEWEVTMITSPVHSSPAVQNETVVKSPPRQNAAAPQTPLPQDRVTISAQAQQSVSADQNHDGDKQ
jgi:hypothetical protein